MVKPYVHWNSCKVVHASRKAYVLEQYREKVLLNSHRITDKYALGLTITLAMKCAFSNELGIITK